jgi:membrane dipeptidase
MKMMSKLTKENKDRAVELHRRSIVIDALVPIQDALPSRLAKGERKVFEKRYLARMLEGGVSAANVIVGNPHARYALEILRSIIDFRSDLEESSDRFCIITKAEEIEEAKKKGKIGIIFGLQNAEPIEGDLKLLKVFYELGVRIIIPCYVRKSMIGDGGAERTNCGLSNFGVEVIKEMNRLGILIDLSHTARATFMDALEVSSKPVVATHSNVYSIVQTPRNLDDEQIKAVAKKAGVIGITAFPGFVARPRATVEHLLDHIDYIVKLVGVDHVGVGFDFLDWEKESLVPFAKEIIKRNVEVFGSTVDFPEGIEDITKFVNITKGLVARGYSDNDVIKILGGNFLRVFKNIF